MRHLRRATLVSRVSDRLDLLYLAAAGQNLPSVRFRVLPFVAEAQARGLRAEWRTVPKTAAGRAGFALTLPRARAIVLQKRLLTAPELAMLRRRADLVAFDFDDALWTCHPNVTDQAQRDRVASRAAGGLERTAARVDLVVAGNAYLAGRMKALARRVEILPTPIDARIYLPPARRAESGRITVGWMGTSCNLFFLPEVFEALRRISDLVRVFVVSDEPCVFPHGLPATFMSWSPAAEVEHLQAMDVGLMPLTDDEYTRGKCGFKLLQYMACGTVPVASDVGFNREIVRHGVNGFLVRGAAETVDCVERLARDPALRRDMAEAARRTVEEKFSLEAAADKLFAWLGLGGRSAGFRGGRAG
ncbi:MAG: glycosyltransferase family 4 protein [Thermodesulfobacteriota bacterium]